MSIESSVRVVSEPWKNSPYYDEAEQWTHLWWDEEGNFRPLFNRLDLESTVELACGHGRHSERVKPLAGKLTLMDVLPENIEFCRKRIGTDRKVAYHVNNGSDFRPLADESVTAIFCYDAMVHFSPDLVDSYLRDAQRILKHGGMVLLHHSNFAGPELEHYGMHPSARNIMPRLQFQKYANDRGLAILASVTIPWGGIDDLDCVTLLQKV